LHFARTNIAIGDIGFSIGISIIFLGIGYIYIGISKISITACWRNIFCLPNIGLTTILILVANIDINLTTISISVCWILDLKRTFSKILEPVSTEWNFVTPWILFWGKQFIIQVCFGTEYIGLGINAKNKQ
jgi:hypothetical protein